MVVRVSLPIARAAREPVPGHWLGPALVMALGLAMAWVLTGFGHGLPLALAVVVGAAALALWNSPLRSSGHEPLESVRDVARVDPAVVVLWRPGCPYSSALRRRAAREGLDVHWVNIWRDEDAYELCCTINKGSEETPTAMMLDPALAGPVVIPASVPGILEATGSRARRSLRPRAY